MKEGRGRFFNSFKEKKGQNFSGAPNCLEYWGCTYSIEFQKIGGAQPILQSKFPKYWSCMCSAPAAPSMFGAHNISSLLTKDRFVQIKHKLNNGIPLE